MFLNISVELTEEQLKKGIVDATNKQAAITRLRAQGINPRELEESKSILHKELSIGGKVKNQDFVIYSRQFATLIRAGVSILESTKILADQTSSKPLKKGLRACRRGCTVRIVFFRCSSQISESISCTIREYDSRR